MGLPPAVEPAGEEAARGWPRAPATIGVACCYQQQQADNHLLLSLEKLAHRLHASGKTR